MIARLGDVFRFRRSLGVKQGVILALVVVVSLFVAVMPAFADSHAASTSVVPHRALLSYMPGPPSGCYWYDLESDSVNASPYWLYASLSGAYHNSDGSPCYTYLATCEVEIDAYHTAGSAAECGISDDTRNSTHYASWTVPASGTQFIYSYQWFELTVSPGDEVSAFVKTRLGILGTGGHSYVPTRPFGIRKD